MARLLTPGRPATWLVVGVLVTAGALAAGVRAATPRQEPTFRSGVDLIAVEVQVVDKDGYPVTQLGATQFSVSISGHKRKVVSADFVRNAEVVEPVNPKQRITPTGPVATNQWPDGGTSTGPGRMFVLAIDVNSLDVGESRGMMAAARGFLNQLQPSDYVGLFVFPIGPKVDPTTNHVAVARALDTVVGQRQAMLSRYNLTPAEIIDINAENARIATQSVSQRTTVANSPNSGNTTNATTTSALQPVIDPTDALRRVQVRECDLNDTTCLEGIQQEAAALAVMYEGLVTESLNDLRSLMLGMADSTGRKTVLVLSGGMAASDRPGSRLNLDDLAKTLGQDAARANTTIYSLYLDTSVQQTYMPERRKTDKLPVSRARDSALLGHVLDIFAGASGGAMMQILMGSGEQALDRVLRETSSHYLLGVEPDTADRDGKLRELRVGVDMHGVTVRSRMWVVVPKRRV